MKNSSNENIENSNTQDIFLRNASLALIDLLNRNVIIQLVRNGKVEDHSIPFFYNFGGDKGFMQDFFLELPDSCKYPSVAEGNFDVIPRGIVTFKSFAIQTADITNKYVRGTFTQEELNDDNVKVQKAYSARLYAMPMQLDFDIKIKSDNLNKTFKIIEKMFDFYYKNRVIYFQYRGIRVAARVIFPDTSSNDKKYDFIYSDETYIENIFTVKIETYFPSFDDHSKMYKGDNIQQFNTVNRLSDSGTVISDTFLDIDNKKE